MHDIAIQGLASAYRDKVGSLLMVHIIASRPRRTASAAIFVHLEIACIKVE